MPHESDPTGPARLTKSPQVESDCVGEETILMHVTNLQLRVLNDVGAVLWDALDEAHTIPELVDLLAEARPELDRPTHEKNVREFVASLQEAGFVQTTPATR